MSCKITSSKHTNNVRCLNKSVLLLKKVTKLPNCSYNCIQILLILKSVVCFKQQKLCIS